MSKAKTHEFKQMQKVGDVVHHKCIHCGYQAVSDGDGLTDKEKKTYPACQGTGAPPKSDDDED